MLAAASSGSAREQEGRTRDERAWTGVDGRGCDDRDAVARTGHPAEPEQLRYATDGPAPEDERRCAPRQPLEPGDVRAVDVAAQPSARVDASLDPDLEAGARPEHPAPRLVGRRSDDAPAGLRRVVEVVQPRLPGEACLLVDGVEEEDADDVRLAVGNL